MKFCNMQTNLYLQKADQWIPDEGQLMESYATMGLQETFESDKNVCCLEFDDDFMEITLKQLEKEKKKKLSQK